MTYSREWENSEIFKCKPFETIRKGVFDLVWNMVHSSEKCCTKKKSYTPIINDLQKKGHGVLSETVFDQHHKGVPESLAN